MIAMRITKATMVSPIRDFLFSSSSNSQPGTRNRPRTRAGGAASGRSMVGSSCDISQS